MIQTHPLATRAFIGKIFLKNSHLSCALKKEGRGWWGDNICKGPEARKSNCHIQEIEINLL